VGVGQNCVIFPAALFGERLLDEGGVDSNEDTEFGGGLVMEGKIDSGALP
jgi:hypothetical protein